MRSFAILTLAATALIVTGCGSSTSRQPPVQVFPDMRAQGKYKPQSDRSFFSDRRGSRLPVEGTVAVGHLKEDDAYFSGVVNN